MVRRGALFALAALLALAGCKSAGIKDAYMSRDEDGKRRTAKFHPEWENIWAIVEWVSGREDARLRPQLSVVEPSPDASDKGVGVEIADDEYREFGDLAPGKGETKVALKLGKTYPPLAPNQKPPNWPRGKYRIDLRIDDETDPAHTLKFTISD